MDRYPSIAAQYFSQGGARYIGLGFYWAWLFIAFYTSVLLPASPAAGHTMSGIWNWAGWAHALTLISCALLARRLQPFALRHISIALCSTGTFVGTLLIPLGALALGPDSPAAIVITATGAVITGVTTAWLVLSWSVLYSRRGARFSLFGIIASYLLAALIFFLVQLMSAPIAIATTALMPICSGILLYAASTESSPAEPLRSRERTVLHRFAPRVILPLAAVLLYALCGEMLRGFATAPGGRGSLDDMGNLYLLGSAVGLVVMGAILALIPRFAHKKPSEMPGIRATLLIMAAGFLATTLTSASFFFAYAVFGAAFQCFRALVWMYSADVAERTGVPAFTVFGASQGCAAFAVVLGVPIAESLNQAVSVGTAQLPVIASVAVFLIFTTAVLVVNPRDLETAWGLVPAAAKRDWGEHVEYAIEPINGSGQTDAACGQNDTPCADGSDTACASEHAAVAEQGTELSGGAENAERDAADARNVAESGEDADTLGFLVDEYGLTAREYEVALLLARGRSLPFIQSELHIAQGTAQTHLVHIYRKLDVHSRQEFLDIVEAQGNALS